MPAHRLRHALLAALVLGAAVVLVTWIVLLLQAEGPRGMPLDLPGRPAPAPTPRADELRPFVPAPAHAPGAPVALRPVERPRMGPPAILGRVVDRATGQAVPSFQVHVIPHAPGSPLERLDDSVPKPFHRLPGVFEVPAAAGRWDVVVRAPGYLPAVAQDIELPALDYKAREFLVDRGDGLTGTVRDRTGHALANIPVFLRIDALDDARDERPQLTTAHTGLDGRFAFTPLPPGDYSVTLLRPDNAEDRTSGLRVTAGRGTTDVTLYITPRHQVQVIVHDTLGRRVPGARVEVRGEQHFASDSTNAEGMIIAEHVPDGAYTVRVTHRGFADGETTFELLGGAGHSVQWVRLTPEATDG